MFSLLPHKNSMNRLGYDFSEEGILFQHPKFCWCCGLGYLEVDIGAVTDFHFPRLLWQFIFIQHKPAGLHAFSTLWADHCLWAPTWGFFSQM